MDKMILFGIILALLFFGATFGMVISAEEQYAKECEKQDMQLHHIGTGYCCENNKGELKWLK